MSRTPPKMKQLAAINAKVYHTLPVTENGVTFSVEEEFLEQPRTSRHFVKAVDAKGDLRWRTLAHSKIYNEMLEGDVQDVFVVDLFVRENHLVVEFEYPGVFRFDLITGQQQK